MIQKNNNENDQLKGKIQRLIGENSSLNDEVMKAQDGLRLSSNQNQKLYEEINEYKVRITSNNQESETYRQKIQKLMSENNNLSEEMRGAQENLRLSANQISKLNNELKITCNENE